EEVPVAVEDRVVDLGADDAAEPGGEHQGAGVLLVADAEPLHPPAELEVAGEEGEDEHQPEGADLERADVEDFADHVEGREARAKDSTGERMGKGRGAARKRYTTPRQGTSHGHRRPREVRSLPEPAQR